MKKLSFFIMLLCAVTCYGEIVSEVSFNPSRMGDYNYLKVANKATLVGGLETDYLNIRSGGTVTLKNSTSTSATFKVDNQIIGEADTEINYPNAAFVVNDGNGMVYADGGEGKFVSGEIEDRILSKNNLKQKAGALTGGSVTITGGTTGELYDGESINGFWLDGNLIPTPTSLKNKNCEMVWETRRPASSSGTASDVKLLALANCKESSPSPDPESPSSGCGSGYISCVELVEEGTNYHYSCPGGWCDRSYEDCKSAYNTWYYSYNQAPSYLYPGVLIPNRFPGWRQRYRANCPTPITNTGGSYSYDGYVIYLVGKSKECCLKSSIIHPETGKPEYN